MSHNDIFLQTVPKVTIDRIKSHNSISVCPKVLKVLKITFIYNKKTEPKVGVVTHANA